MSSEAGGATENDERGGKWPEMKCCDDQTWGYRREWGRGGGGWGRRIPGDLAPPCQPRASASGTS